MTLCELAKEIELAAKNSGVEIFIDDTTLNHNFIPIVNEQGIVGAIGQYLEDKKIKTGYFILNHNIVRYGLSEGFSKDELFDSFKDKIFTETGKEKFFSIMTEKKY